MKILFGDNQYLGVNHASQAGAARSMSSFSSPADIAVHLDEVCALGVDGFAFTTSEKYAGVFDRLPTQEIPSLYPCIPYAHTYADLLAKRGIFGAFESLVTGSKFMFAWSSLKTALGSSPDYFVNLIIDSEIKALPSKKIEAVVLNNVMTDLMLGLNFDEFLISFDRCCRKRGVEPGFITMNLPVLADRLARLDLQPLVFANLNPPGLRMAPNQQAVEAVILERRFKLVAMSPFASGLASIEEAISYFEQLPRLDGVLFGGSSLTRIENNISSFRGIKVR